MKFISMKLFSAVAMAIAGVLCSGGAYAQGTFTAASSTDTCNPGSSSVSSLTCTKGAVSATLKAFGYTGTLSSTAATGFTSAYIGDFNSDGLGVYSGSKETSLSSQHAFDNLTTGCGSTNNTTTGLTSTCGGSIEGMLLDFGTSKVKLTDIGLGYISGDADVMIWAYTGGSNVADASTLVTGAKATGSTSNDATIASGSTAATLSGWTLVSSLNFGTTKGVQTISSSIYSSYFLITTYFGAASTGLTAGDDKFKLNQFTVASCSSTTTNGGNCTTTTTTKVPEPGSLALVGAALLGAYGLRRRSVTKR